ncbi:ABC transporter ATP-binding protein [Kibdelosporangium philippinense]
MTARRQAILLALRYYWHELVRQRRYSIPAMLFPAFGNTCILYIAPLAVAQLAGHLASGGTNVVPYVVAFAGLMLLAELFWRIGLHMLNRAGGLGSEHLNTFAMQALLAKDAAFFHDNFAGSLTKRELSFASRYVDILDTLAFQVVSSVIPLGFASVILWTYDPVLVLVMIGMITVTGVAVAPLIKRRQVLVDKREAAIARVSGHVADSLTNMETVRAFAAEEREAAEHRSRVAEHRRLTVRSWDYGNLKIDMVVAPLYVLTTALGLLLAVSLGNVGVEEVIVTFTYFTAATRIMFEFNQIYRRIESSLTEAAQFTELLLDSPKVVDPDNPEELKRTKADVHFDNVSFTHAGASSPLFTGLNLTVPNGTKVGLVGRSGGGKSTLSKLLLRMMDIHGGRIMIGGQDISKLKQADLRSLIAYVPQDPAMFHRTLKENIAFARPGATDEEILRAAKAAHVAEFAVDLPQGFDTLVGERGVKLSGGQRQRVALARAILRDAPILLLDEATSALDSESEILVQQALWQLMENRTAIVVAHRLSTVAQMDQLVVLDQGEIVERGSHSELLELDGTYARLWQHQSGGFLDDTDQPISR